MVESRWVCSAVLVSVLAAASSSVEDDETVWMISPTAFSNRSASLCISAVRCSTARFSASVCSARNRSISIILSLKTRTAPAIFPISSIRSTPATITEVLPVASVPIVPVSVWIGLTIERAVKSAIVPAAPSPVARSAHSVVFRQASAALFGYSRRRSPFRKIPKA
jgi:hypothetical protein